MGTPPGAPDHDDPSVHALSHDPPHALTPREREVFLLLARGHGAARIAAMLQTSPKTTYTHRERILRKLGCASDAELAIFAREQGVV